ncbi:TPA_asm: hypothetical protein ES702_05916 [Lokiarchaeia virus SkuldV3]|uniref:Uncharacterized protein n=1 Tax=Lokiarchaeia virus SkuldV3 TaxID=2983915 RepID=A0A9N6YJC0_9VIRU|nr:hypothetical protein QKT74_gp13 [Lokiarchaeia virus SkuldV3]DAZ90953.1 TPA_asm: hypothetical protein ES702_05916 [Lokiarchaeia virus SkuldV3]
MTDDTTDIDLKDIKQPKKLAKKLGKIGLLGLGAIAQEFITAQISEKTDTNKTLISGGEVILSGLAGGYVKNTYAKSFLGGMMAGASKDFVSNLIVSIKEGGLKGIFKPKEELPPPADNNNAIDNMGDYC